MTTSTGDGDIIIVLCPATARSQWWAMTGYGLQQSKYRSLLVLERDRKPTHETIKLKGRVDKGLRPSRVDLGIGPGSTREMLGCQTVGWGPLAKYSIVHFSFR